MSKEIKIALLVIIALVVSIWGYKYIIGKNLLKKSNVYYVDYQNVNEEILISWVKEKYGESELNNIEKMLLQKLEAKQNEFINGLPF